MATSVAIRHKKESTNDEYLKSFPPFLWLLRDAFLETPPTDEIELTPTEFLTRKVLDGDNPDSMEVAVRQALEKFFPSFICKTLPIPTADPEVMRTITTQQKKLTDLFNHKVDELITFLKANVHPKQVFSNAGALCYGHTLALLVQQVANAVNDPNSIPALDSTWKLVLQSRCRDVQEKLIAEYSTTIKTRYDSASQGKPLEEETESSQEQQNASVIGIHNKLWNEIKERFHKEIGPLLSVPVSEECTLESMTDQLEKQLVQFQLETDNGDRKVSGGVLYTIAEENRKRSREHCNKVFTELHTRIRRRAELAEDGYTAETLEADIENLWKEYDSKSVGPEKMSIRNKMQSQIEENKRMLQELLQRAQDRKEFREFCKKVDTKLEKRIQAEEERREKLEKQLEEKQKSLEEEQQRMLQESQRLADERHIREKVEVTLEQMNRTLEERQARLDEEKNHREKIRRSHK